MSKFLNQDGVQHLVEKVKDGTIVSGKTLEVVAGGKVPASTITGVIDISHIPNGALERLVKVANKAARLKLTANDIQLGDTVQELDTGLMFIVVDQTKLNSDDGYQEYTAGKATKAASADSVEWSGIQNKPTNVADSGLLDAINSTHTAGEGNVVVGLIKSDNHTVQGNLGWVVKSIITPKDSRDSLSANKNNSGAINLYLSDFIETKHIDEVNNYKTVNPDDHITLLTGANDPRSDNDEGLMLTSFALNASEEPAYSSRLILLSDGNIYKQEYDTTNQTWRDLISLIDQPLSNDDIDAAIAAAK